MIENDAYCNDVLIQLKAVESSTQSLSNHILENHLYNCVTRDLENGELDCQVFGRGFAWLDTGTVDSLAKASDYVKLVVEVQGIRISVPEEIAYYNKWIDEKTLLEAAETYGKSPYGEHLRTIAKGNVQTTYLKEKK